MGNKWRKSPPPPQHSTCWASARAWQGEGDTAPVPCSSPHTASERLWSCPGRLSQTFIPSLPPLQQPQHLPGSPFSQRPTPHPLTQKCGPRHVSAGGFNLLIGTSQWKSTYKAAGALGRLFSHGTAHGGACTGAFSCSADQAVPILASEAGPGEKQRPDPCEQLARGL